MLDAAPDGPLRGVPVVIKDEWPLPWRAQRFGAAEMLAGAPGESGPYRALRDAGAVIVGVGNMHEVGASSTGNVSVYGPAHNPWNLERCPGGSSSGPAAAVAGGIVAGAVGADGLGSIRYPGRLLRPDRAEADLRPLGDGGAPHGGGHDDDRLRPALRRRRRRRLLGSVLFGEELRAGDAAGLRIGVVRDAVSEDVAPAVREACEAAIQALREETGGEVARGRAGGLGPARWRRS